MIKNSDLRARTGAMPLLCQLGRHLPEPLARWNDGYYFTRCRRCGCDLVRPLYGRWQVPRGFRVVWQSRPPRSHRGAQLVRDDGSRGAPGARRSNAPVRSELPIAEVLRHLHGEELDRSGTVHEPNGAREAPAESSEVASSQSAELWGGGTETHQAIGNGRPEPADAVADDVAQPPGDQAEPQDLVSEEAEAGGAVAAEPAEPEAEAETDIDQSIEEVEPEADTDIDQLVAEPEPEAQVESGTETAAQTATGVAEETETGPNDEAEGEAEPHSEGAEGEAEVGEAEVDEAEKIDLEEPGGRRSVVPDFMSDSSPETDWLFIPTPPRPTQIVEPEPAGVAEVSGEAAVGDEETPPSDAEADAQVQTPRAEAEADAPLEGPIQAPVDTPTEAAAATLTPAASAAVESQPVPFQAGADQSPAERIIGLAAGIGDSLKTQFARFTGWVRDLRLDAIVRPEGDEQPSLTPTGMLLAISLPFLFLITVVLVSRDPRPGEPPAPQPERAVSPAASASTSSTGAEPAFVTASLLNCRSAPARQARPVRRLARGDAIEILALDGEWASITARGEQCWVLARYISTARPALGLASSGGAQPA